MTYLTYELNLALIHANTSGGITTPYLKGRNTASKPVELSKAINSFDDILPSKY